MIETANPTTTNQLLTPNQIPTTPTTQATTPNHGTRTKNNPTGKTTGKNANIHAIQITVATPTTAQTQKTLGSKSGQTLDHQLTQINSHTNLSLKRNHLQLFHFQQVHTGETANCSMDPQS